MIDERSNQDRVRVAQPQEIGELARTPEQSGLARATQPGQLQPNVALSAEQRREVARLAAAAPPAPPSFADLGLAQRLDAGSMTMLNRLVGGNLARQQQFLNGGEPQQGALGKVLASEYLAGTSPTLDLANPILSGSDYSEQDLLILLASYSAEQGGLSDAEVQDALLASRSFWRRLWRRITRR